MTFAATVEMRGGDNLQQQEPTLLALSDKDEAP